MGTGLREEVLICCRRNETTLVRTLMRYENREVDGGVDGGRAGDMDPYELDGTRGECVEYDV
jgi:hypothetical protein